MLVSVNMSGDPPLDIGLHGTQKVVLEVDVDREFLSELGVRLSATAPVAPV